MLDRAATVEEAAKLLGDYNMWSAFPRASFHFLVADKPGAAKVLEYDNDNVLHVFDANYVTNFYLNEDVQALITTPSHHDHGLDRYNKIEARLKAASNVLSENEAMALLKDVSQKPGETGTSNTRWSVVYNLSSLTAKVAAAQDYDNIFSFQLKEMAAARPAATTVSSPCFCSQRSLFRRCGAGNTSARHKIF